MIVNLTTIGSRHTFTNIVNCPIIPILTKLLKLIKFINFSTAHKPTKMIKISTLQTVTNLSTFIKLIIVLIVSNYIIEHIVLILHTKHMIVNFGYLPKIINRHTAHISGMDKHGGSQFALGQK